MSKSSKAWVPLMRARIEGANVAEQLIDHLTNRDDDGIGKDIMTASQVNAARILLSKVLPDLKAVEVTGEVGLAVTEVIRKIVDGRDSSTD